MEVSEWAAAEAERLLGESWARWLHVQGVARLASEVRGVLPPSEGSVLLAAAFLHDIGYSPELHATGAHQLDGARYLRSLRLERLACLVAHHSAARFEIEARGFLDELATYDLEESPVSDALTYCDMLTGASGEPMSVEERLEDIERRHGSSGLVVEALRLARPELDQAVKRTEQRLAQSSQPM